jgi:hypothetical protein
MSLDLTKVAAQVEGMVDELKAGGEDRQNRLNHALEVLHGKSDDFDNLKKKILASKTTWLVAGLVDGLNRRYNVSSLPDEFTVIATDGSHIDVDRHQSTRCYLINIGSVVLKYGSNPDALLESRPHLYAGDEELVIRQGDGSNRIQMIEGTLLGIKRSVEECRRLSELAAELPADCSCLALQDGTLIMWGLEAYPEFVTESVLDKGFLSYLDEIKKCNIDKKLSLASYISYPRSTDVVNALQVALCPYNPLDTDIHCKNCVNRECDAVASVRDRDVFSNLLADGERSDIFISQSSINDKRYGIHRVYFFYVRVEDEVARIEVPEWVAKDEYLLGLTHSLVLDQCRRGHGYPVVLSEAHEQAVVTGVDRDNFWSMVESSLIEEHISTPTSAKSRSKRTRWI